jgi:ribosome-associated toxin RatA of RatAB toxin-antitoxin module
MARIQQSVEIKAPAHVAYNQLTQFEDYPRFMDEVESAEQVDDTHVRWTTKIGQHARDWQSEIVEQKPDQCIAWRNVEGPVSTGRVEVQQLGADSSRVTFTVESEATSAGEAAEAMARQVGENLQRLKQMIESGGETGAWRGEVHDGKVEVRGRDADGGAAAGTAGGAAASTQSDNALSDNADQSGQDGRFSVAEEVNTDQQSDAAGCRHGDPPCRQPAASERGRLWRCGRVGSDAGRTAARRAAGRRRSRPRPGHQARRAAFRLNLPRAGSPQDSRQ